jgi:hypothetical protein
VEETATTGHALGSREEELMARYVQQTAGIVCVCVCVCVCMYVLKEDCEAGKEEKRGGVVGVRGGCSVRITLLVLSPLQLPYKHVHTHNAYTGLSLPPASFPLHAPDSLSSSGSSIFPSRPPSSNSRVLMSWQAAL